MREMLLFPYQQGQQFAMALFASGGTEALDAAFRSPPTCTRDVLHPEKFLRQRTMPERIELPSLKSTDWRLIGNNVLGEFGTRFVLQQGLGLFEAQTVAQGWNGDRYHVYERGTNGPTGLIWETAWETEQAAKDFKQAYERVMSSRSATGTLQRSGLRVRVEQSMDSSFLDLLRSLGASH
jgi:hypothetical protein